MIIPFEWEPIDSNLEPGQQTSRAKVFGGWLVKEEIYVDDDGDFRTTQIALTFVPDCDHEWEIAQS